MFLFFNSVLHYIMRHIIISTSKDHYEKIREKIYIFVPSWSYQTYHNLII